MGPTYRPPKRLLVAIGGNAIHPDNIKGTPEEQVNLAASTANALLPIMALENQLIITHGNGPVVGKIQMRQAIAKDRVAPMSLDICVAHSQGGIAYLLMQALENALREAHSSRQVVCLLTQVEVDPKDHAFQKPSKPIGYFYDEEEARVLTQTLGWEMRDEPSRGWRHIVPSPEPKHIVDISLISTLVETGAVVIAGGGGGIPVERRPNGVRRGLEAVIDKDLTSAHMANILGIEVMMILTAVSRVAVHFGTSRQRELEQVSLSEVQAYQTEGQFPSGSMGPKIAAAIRFLQGGGKRVIIAHLNSALPALRGETGTQILSDGD